MTKTIWLREQVFAPGARNRPARKKADASPMGSNICAVFWSNVVGHHPGQKKTYMSMIERRGKKKTIIALGHKILITTYFIIKDKVVYNELGPDHLNNFKKDRLVACYKKQLEKLEEV